MLERRFEALYWRAAADILFGEMQAEAHILFAFLNGWEVVALLAVVLVLFGAKNLPGLGHGVGRGIFEARNALEKETHDAGESLGGIYGKPTFQAVTPDNHIAELYDPADFRTKARRKLENLKTRPLKIHRWLTDRLRAILRSPK